MDQVAVARRVAIAWGRLVGHDRMCIEATRYAIEALGRLGVEARPLPCSILVLNHFAYSLATRKVTVDQWPPWAYSVGVAPSRQPAEPLERSWNGHLVVEGVELIADLTLGAFARPNRGIRVGPWAWAKGRDIRCIDGSWVAVSNDLVVHIEPRPELARWRQTSAWRRTPRQDLVDELVAAARPIATQPG